MSYGEFDSRDITYNVHDIASFTYMKQKAKIGHCIARSTQ